MCCQTNEITRLFVGIDSSEDMIREKFFDLLDELRGIPLQSYEIVSVESVNRQAFARNVDAVDGQKE